MKYLLGYDIGSSSVKASLLDIASGRVSAAAFSPDSEMSIHAPAPGFAEQDPESWWAELVAATRKLRSKFPFRGEEVAAIGISYQMHGLVTLDDQMQPVRPAIIWCDSRAVSIGQEAAAALGSEFCLAHYLNAPGNFTASKMKWVQMHEPQNFSKTKLLMLPGDYVAFKLTGEAATTISGLSEGILWDYLCAGPATDLMRHYALDASLLPPMVPQIGIQGRVHKQAAEALGLISGIPVSYRAGDQPNNAWSLQVLSPGQIAATAGTSGVVYGVTDKAIYDPKSRVNGFVHVNHKEAHPSYGILLCVNGTGILNSWMKKNLFRGLSYDEINQEGLKAPIGSDGLTVYPFGNGAERILENADPGAIFRNISFNRHGTAHMARAAQEGIVFALQYGIDIMQEMGMQVHLVRAGSANMFLSPLFTDAFCHTAGCQLELYDTDGAAGAARAAGLGAGIFADPEACFKGIQLVQRLEPVSDRRERYLEAYHQWRKGLESLQK